MKLSKGDFSQFSLKSKKTLLENKGLMLMKKRIGRMHEIHLFLLFDFYVEVFFDSRKNEILKVEPVLNQIWIDLYLKSGEK